MTAAPVTRRARQTGTPVTVAHANDCGLELAPEYGLVWYTVCDAHGSCVGHSSRRLALWHAADPAGWCEECHAALQPPCARCSAPHVVVLNGELLCLEHYEAERVRARATRRGLAW